MLRQLAQIRKGFLEWFLDYFKYSSNATLTDLGMRSADGADI